MKDIKEQILSTKRTHRVFVPTQVPHNCAAGRCGHKSIAMPKIAFIKEDVLNVMDEYAKQEAIDFAIFCANNVLGVFPTDVKEREWYYQDKTGRYNKTTEQLYDIFLQSKGK